MSNVRLTTTHKRCHSSLKPPKDSILVTKRHKSSGYFSDEEEEFKRQASPRPTLHLAEEAQRRPRGSFPGWRLNLNVKEENFHRPVNAYHRRQQWFEKRKYLVKILKDEAENPKPINIKEIVDPEWDELKKHHRLIWRSSEEEDNDCSDGYRKSHNPYTPLEEMDRVSLQKKARKRVAKQRARNVHKLLYKEFGLVDMSRYKKGQFGIRFRVEDEVFRGKGETTCGNKKCDVQDGLVSFQTPFSYMENEKLKSALIKLRLCPDCGYKLHYHQDKKRKRKKKKKKGKSKRSKKKKNTTKCSFLLSESDSLSNST